MRCAIRFGFLSLLGLLLMSSPVCGQEVSAVIGAKSLARDCYERSQQAARLSKASIEDIKLCNRAIFEAGLKKVELAATYTNRGVIRMAMQDFKKAYSDYNKALSLDPDLSEAYINRGNLWFALQQFEKAIMDYDKALALGVSQADVAHLNRGLSNENLGHLKLAKQDYLSALRIRQSWQAALDKLERVNSKLRK